MGLFERCKSSTKTLSDARRCAVEQYAFGFDHWLDRTGLATLPEFIDALKAKKMSVYLMIWPVPSKQYVTSLQRLSDFVQKHPVDGVEIEDEENWGTDYISGYKTNNEAALDMFAKLRASLPKGVAVGVTTAPRNFLPSRFSNDALVKLADFISYQTYQNVCNHGGDRCVATKLSGDYAPGRMQDRALALLRQIGLRPGVQVILGLPAYDQAIIYAGDVNMIRALAHSVCSQAKGRYVSSLMGFSYWSYNNVQTKNGEAAYARRFMANCQPRDVERICSIGGEDDLAKIQTVCPNVFR